MNKNQYEFIIYEKLDGVGKIIFNNPARNNAMSAKMLTELKDVLLNAQFDGSVNVLVLTGAGDKAFSSGQDFALPFEGAGTSVGTYNYLRNVCYEAHRLMEKMEKPIIAAVNGHCLAGGFEFALACDFIIASENATFGMLEVGLGILPGSGGIVRLCKALPVRKAKELLFTTRRFSAKEAEAMGIVNKVVPQGKLAEAVKEITDSICQKSPLAIRLAKMVANASIETTDIDVALALERSAGALISASEDAREGPIAFLQKRPPVFKGK
ncbi:MAG: enoyl-CoA hydratase/isomerase family protein [Dehalococcoidia bacterium]|nr:enoyl-CoA hydratase/isomerase family protein [Dehalococcoidia bacterium]MDD5493478.1 enoyl-CoA hydratase/isomerase family protein [Dehalococcoidia bacterium]